MPAQNVTFLSSPHITKFPYFKLHRNNYWKIKKLSLLPRCNSLKIYSKNFLK